MMALEDLAPAVIGFVMVRNRKDRGGFAAAPSLPPSVEDTYFALRILETLQPFSEDHLTSLSKNQSLREYLLKREDTDSWSLRTAFRYLMACRIVGVDPDDAWIRRLISSRVKKDHDLEAQYYIKRILKEGLTEPAPQTDRKVMAGYLAEYRTVGEFWKILYLAEGKPESLLSSKETLISWLHACQNPDGGFGYMPGTTSFMENNYHSLRSLRLLGDRAPSEEDALAFVLRSQGKRGGFARRNGAAPFLDATWYAVATIDLLIPHKMNESTLVRKRKTSHK
jgi:hypothetical protein